jgi:hypothetical protein
MGIEDGLKRARATLARIRGSQERRDRHDEEDSERRSPTAYFHIAEAYFISARQLRSFEPHGHSEHPIRLAYYTALELYLKAFLRRHDVSTATLAKNSLGHRYCCLLEKAASFGLTLMDEDYQVLYFLSYSDERERVRYHETGYTRWTSLEALDRTCLSLRETMCRALREMKLPVWLRKIPVLEAESAE